MNSIQINAGNEIDTKVRAYMNRHGGDYRTAFYKLKEAEPELFRRYDTGDAEVRRYDLTPAQARMAELVADAVKTRRLAGFAVDRLARQQLGNRGQGVPDSAAEYKAAVSGILQANPSLARAASDGFIASDDFELLALLVPAIAGEVERGNYHDSTKCRCGQNRALCREKKLAHKRGVVEDNVKAFAACIRDAHLYGNALDAIRCYY